MPVKRTLRVMIVDDEMLVRGSLKAQLTQLGHTPITFRDPVDAIEAFDRGERFDVAIVDVRMPRMTGDRLIMEIQKRVPEQQVVVLTAHAEREQIAKVVRAGSLVRILLKPWRNEDLVRTLQGVARNKGRWGGAASRAP